MDIKSLFAAVIIFFASTPALAVFSTLPTPVPAPDAISLLGIGAVALILSRWHNRKK